MSNIFHSRRSRLRAASFQEWLAEHQDQIVGRAACENACPLANWLTSVFQVPCEVTCDGYQLLGSDTLRPLPSWARIFIRALDFTIPLDEVSCEYALSLLEHIVYELPSRDFASSDASSSLSFAVPCPVAGSIKGRML